MRPVLKPALRRLWRADDAIQLGTDPEQAVVLRGVDGTASAVLALMDGTRDADEIVAVAERNGVPEADVRRFFALLESVNALDDAAIAPRGRTDAERQRLEPDLAALTLLAPRPGGGARLLDSRRATRVLVAGAGRVGSLVASLLAAAGIGHVAIRDGRVALAGDAVPGGLLPGDRGTARAVAAVAAAKRAGSPSVEGAVRAPNALDCQAADFAVIALDGELAPDPGLLDLVSGAGLPYLLTYVRDTCGVVGPLVVPGRTACPRCLDRHRTERDPGWPMLASQLLGGPRGTPPCDVTLATGLAAVTAGQVLTFLADRAESRCVNATLELRLPAWTLRRRAWGPHPDCPCAAGSAAERDRVRRRRTEATAATAPRRGKRTAAQPGRRPSPADRPVAEAT